jgi:mRNA interferase MazF
MTMVCPLTTTDRKYPFHVSVTNGKHLTGFVMVEQIKSIDFISRKTKYISKASEEVLDTVLSILDACLY